jgi:hypothetical protein
LALLGWAVAGASVGWAVVGDFVGACDGLQGKAITQSNPPQQSVQMHSKVPMLEAHFPPFWHGLLLQTVPRAPLASNKRSAAMGWKPIMFGSKSFLEKS